MLIVPIIPTQPLVTSLIRMPHYPVSFIASEMLGTFSLFISGISLALPARPTITLSFVNSIVLSVLWVS
jgi:hypothetical protein